MSESLMFRHLMFCFVVLSLVALAAKGEGIGAPAGDLSDLKQALGLGTHQQEFLDPDQAFRLTVEVNTPKSLTARWEIADGYYLYRDKFRFHAGGNVSLGKFELPPGESKEDASFGRVEIYRGTFDVNIPLPSEDQNSFTLELGYQGCAEDGICYPPIKKIIPIKVAAVAPLSDPPEKALDKEKLSRQEDIARALAGGALATTLLSFFGFGLLLSLTPCVFPMIPILSSLIVGDGQRITTGRAFILSSLYVLAMALTYALAGIIAGLFGYNLQAMFQSPWVLSLFSLVFVLLALSMFGLFEIQLPGQWQTALHEQAHRQRRGTLYGAAAMGFFSAIIVGPCVAPPLAGALIYIGQSGNATVGGAALFAMALGMGSPLLAIGTSAGKLLPRAGPWMETVKKAFGVTFLGLSLWLLERILPPGLILFLAGLLLIGVAVFLGAADQLDAAASGWRRLAKGTGIAALIYGAVLIVAAAGGGKEIFRPLQTMDFALSGTQTPYKLVFKPVKGASILLEEIEIAKTQQKPVMLDLYADWCIDCKRLDRDTFSDQNVQQALLGTVLLKADVTANDEQDKDLLRMLGVYGPPAVLFFGPNGVERREYRLAGYLGPSDFYSHLHQVFTL
ncbi:MAG: protein-disulfide reductase DsbD [Gammaproteobacteria bacterium]